MTNAILIYLAAINLVTFLIYGVDKLKAKHHWWRVPEATLLLLAVLGGSVGAWLGMQAFRHKTQHKKFKYGVPAIFLLQLTVTIYLLTR